MIRQGRGLSQAYKWNGGKLEEKLEYTGGRKERN